jgi:hypothetical protein
MRCRQDCAQRGLLPERLLLGEALNGLEPGASPFYQRGRALQRRLRLLGQLIYWIKAESPESNMKGSKFRAPTSGRPGVDIDAYFKVSVIITCCNRPFYSRPR